MNAPDPLHWTLNTCFGAFLTICVHLGLLGCLTKLRAKHSELVQKFVRRGRVGVFHDECTHPPHWTLISCFGAFHTIWVHLGPFGCLTKLGAKQTKLVQKFVPRSCIGVFCDEHTRSTPLDPKLSFCYISYHLGAFGTVWLPYETRCKTSRTRAKVCATKLHWNFSQRMHPIHPIGP